jgi:hypothetical protein
MKIAKALIAVFSCLCVLLTQAKASPPDDISRQNQGEMIIHGEVVSTDPVGNTIIVKTEKTLDTLAVESGTKIMLGRMELSKEISLNDLMAGNKVTILWKIIDGHKNAVKIVKESLLDIEDKEGSD